MLPYEPNGKLAGYKRHQKLNQKAQFEALFGTPDFRVSNRAFLVLARYNEHDVARLATIAGKKKARRAVDRHLIKRIFREAFRHHQQPLKGLDILILLRHFDRQTPKQEYRRQVDELLARLLAKTCQD